MGDWTSAEWLLVIGAIGLQLATLIKAWRQGEVVQELKSDAKEALISSKVIEGHVNSEKQAAMGREDVLKTENALLREQLTEARRAAAVLAATTQPTRPARSTDPTAALADDTLVQIEANTADTAKGVQALTDRAPRKDPR